MTESSGCRHHVEKPRPLLVSSPGHIIGERTGYEIMSHFESGARLRLSGNETILNYEQDYGILNAIPYKTCQEQFARDG